MAAVPAWPHPDECSGPIPAKDAQAVRDAIEAYRNAWLRGDAEAVLATLTKDAVLLPAHGAPPVIGTAAIREYWWPAGASPTTITKLNITIEGVGGDCRVAYAHGHDDVWWTALEDGVTRTYGHPGTYLNVLRKLPDGSWRISHHMWDDGTPADPLVAP
jgi:uncharacterized protein (TIGR02246 family)